MEKNTKNIDIMLSVNKETFIAGLEEVNALLAPEKTVKGSNMVRIEAKTKENRLSITGMGLDSSLIKTYVMCEKVEKDLLIYVDSKSLTNTVKKINSAVLEFEFIPNLRRLIAYTTRNTISINAASEADFDEKGNVVPNKETKYAVAEVPIRKLCGRQISDLGDYGSVELPLKQFYLGLKSVSVSPYEPDKGDYTKFKVKGDKLLMTGSNGYQIGACELGNCLVNEVEDHEINFVMKGAMVEKLLVTMNKVLSSVPKKKKSMASAEELKLKISLGKTMMELQMKDVTVIANKYNLELNDVSVLLEQDFVWHGIVNVEDFKGDVSLSLVAAEGEEKKSDKSIKSSFRINLKDNSLYIGLSSDLGKGAVSRLPYTVLVDGESKLKKTRVEVSYEMLQQALGLMSEEETLVRIHVINEDVGIMSFINAANHDVYGFTHGILVNLAE